jgi:hypothetical protein
MTAALRFLSRATEKFYESQMQRAAGRIAAANTRFGATRIPR